MSVVYSRDRAFERSTDHHMTLLAVPPTDLTSFLAQLNVPQHASAMCDLGYDDVDQTRGKNVVKNGSRLHPIPVRDAGTRGHGGSGDAPGDMHLGNVAVDVKPEVCPTPYRARATAYTAVSHRRG